MHHKYAIIDNTVWTGSFNFTQGGSYNQENVMVTENNISIKEQYTEDFNFLWKWYSYNL